MEHRGASWFRSIGGAPGSAFAVVACLSSPCLAAEMAARGTPPFVYPGLVASMLIFMLVATSSGLWAVIRRREARAPAKTGEGTAEVLRAFSSSASGAASPAQSIAVFSRATAAVLGVEPSAVSVQIDAPSEATAFASGPMDGIVADAVPAYDTRPLPLVAENAEIGRVLVDAGYAARGVDEVRLALGTLLCALLAQVLKNAEHRERAAAQAAELEDLRQRLASDANAVSLEIVRPEGFRDIVGTSEALRRTLALVERVAPSEVAVLVTGETGTGKEGIARAVHQLSARRDGPQIAVNCPAIPGPLAESELFGHERGAFTDAVAARPGQFEMAHGGTILLDEVADLPLDIQAKLLRVLQEGEVRRVGGHRARPIDVRTVAATNRDLLALVREGRFREDLYYRLAAVEIALPPLRARHGDVPILAAHFLEQAKASYGKALNGFSADTIATLCNYSWPGNVRQLQNVVHRAVLLCRGDVVRPADLAEIGEAAVDGTPRFGDSIRQEKKRRFLEALHQSGWNQSAAARLLGMSRSNFARMVRSLEIAIPKGRGRG